MSGQYAFYPPRSSGGGASVGTAFQETPAGLLNNSNVTFTLTNTPISGTLLIFVNTRQTTDYSIVGTTITMGVAPDFGGSIYAYYRY